MNKRILYTVKAIVFVLLVIVLTSCKAKFKLLSSSTKELKINTLINNIEKNYYDYNTLSVKFQAKYDNGKRKQNIQGIYRIGKDSIIWLSMGPTLGMEIIRAVIYPDSMKFLNRYEKTYYEGKYDYLNNILKIDFNHKSLENLLTNRLLFSENEYDNWQSYISKNYSYEIKENRYLLKRIESNTVTSDDNFLETLEKIIVIPNLYKVECLCWKDEKNNRQFKLKYGNYKKDKILYYPDNININIINNNDSINVDLKIKQISIDKKIKYPFKVPKRKYTKLEY